MIKTKERLEGQLKLIYIHIIIVQIEYSIYTYIHVKVMASQDNSRCQNDNLNVL